MIPGETFSAEGLHIVFPDSLYNSGRIAIRKAQFPSFKIKDYTYHFSENTVQSVVMKISASDRSAFIDYLKSVLLNPPAIISSGDLLTLKKGISKMLFSQTKKGKRYHIEMHAVLDRK